MKLKYLFTIAFNALKSYKIRTLLTSIGIIIGISSIIITMGMGNSAKVNILSKITSFGKNTLWLKMNQGGIQYRQMSLIQREVAGIKNQSSLGRAFIKSYHQKYKYKAFIYGINEKYFSIKGQAINLGRDFTKFDIVSNKKTALVCPDVIKELYQGQNPMGKNIIINNTPFLIIGTLPKRGKTLGSLNYDSIVYIPISTMVNLFKPDKKVSDAIFQAESRRMVPILKKRLTTYLIKHLKLNNTVDHSSYFKIPSTKERLEVADRISNSMTIFVIAIAAISLVIGGIGVMNIMLVSVTNRTREIGIRLAIGAKERDVLMQFLIESLSLSFLGGFIGIFIGISVYAIIVSALGWKFMLSIPSIFLAFFFTALVGIIFGYYPAKKAASLKPIEALKHE